MGTSQSSKGPASGVPMVPPWVPDPVSPDQSPGEDNDNPTDGDDQDGHQPDGAAEGRDGSQPVSLLAPSARFGGARRNLGTFARTGDAANMRRGLGLYVGRGYGGSETAVKRFEGTATTARALYRALSGVTGGQAVSPENPLDSLLLAGQSAQGVMDALVEAVRPADGTQDAEADRAAIRDALSELLTEFPRADLVDLSEAQRVFGVERFVAIDVYRHFQLDLGKTLQDKAPTASAGLARLKEVKDYIKETVAAAFRTLRDGGVRLTTGRVNEVVRAALRETFQVFESYIS